jgi:hypothetical protein
MYNEFDKEEFMLDEEEAPKKTDMWAEDDEDIDAPETDDTEDDEEDADDEDEEIAPM